MKLVNSIRKLAVICVCGMVVFCLHCQLGMAQVVSPPSSFGPLPSARQLEWHELEFYGLAHFGPNTFSNREIGSGAESPDLFNPTAFDADQIVSAFKSAGMKGLVLVCKHHDGFCLWPTSTTKHSVKSSSWRQGKGDVVKDISEACRKQGMKFGVYFSPWDRNNASYGRPEYLTLMRAQLSELLTNYGPVFTAWFDGANGGEGYYGGAKEKRIVDRESYYDWPGMWKLIHKLQPMSCIFSDAGPDVRWVGNENGYAGDPCWSTIDIEGTYPGMLVCTNNTSGQRFGKNWVPAECDVSLHPAWFYHERADMHPKSVRELVNIYFQTVGKGASLNLNVGPDKRGLIPASDAKTLSGLGAWLSNTFQTDIAMSAKVVASNVRAGASEYSADKVKDGNRKTYWATDDQVTTPELVLEWDNPVTFSVVRLREYLSLGQRVERFCLDEWQLGQWKEFYQTSSIGNQRLIRVKPLTTNKIRLRITQSPVCPAISEFGVFLEPSNIEGAVPHK